MSSTITNLVAHISDEILKAHSEKFMLSMQQQFSQNPNGGPMLQLLNQKYTEARTQIIGNLDQLQVSIQGAQSSVAQSSVPGNFGLFQPGMSQPSQPQQAQTVTLPKNSVKTLAECGQGARCMISQYPGGAPDGAICGCEFQPNSVPHSVFCNSKATKEGTSGYYTCNKHKNRTSLNRDGKSKKSNPKSGNAMASAAQMRSLQTPGHLNPQIQSDPQAQARLAQLMNSHGTTAAVNPLVQAAQSNPLSSSPFGQQQSQTLMNSVASQVGQSNPLAAPGSGQVNLSNLLGGQQNPSVNILSEVPSAGTIQPVQPNPLAQPNPFAQQSNPLAQSQTVQQPNIVNPLANLLPMDSVVEENDEPEDDDSYEESDDEDDSDYEPVSENALQDALNAANTTNISSMLQNNTGVASPLGGI